MQRTSNAELLRRARVWLALVPFRHEPSVVDFLRDQELRNDVEQYYPGGWTCFVVDQAEPGFVVATDRAESETCQAGTPGCCVDHVAGTTDVPCQSW